MTPKARWRAQRNRRHVARTLGTARRLGTDAVVLGDPVVDAPDLEIGDNFMIWAAHRQTLISGPGRIRIGHRVFVNVGTIIYAELAVTIGDDVALANEVYLMDTPSHGLEGRAPEAAPVAIGSGSWIGARAIILPGVTIGTRVVVAAGSVVTRDVPDDVMVGGNPSRLIRPLQYPEHCRRAWHDVYCRCPGSLFGPALEVG